jgi:hypothetical protein
MIDFSATQHENPYQAPQSDANPKRVSYSPTDPLLATGHWLTVSGMLMLFVAGGNSARVTYGGVNLLGVLALAMFFAGLWLIGRAVLRISHDSGD